MKNLLILCILFTPLMSIWVLFNGYPNEFVSIAIGVACGLMGIMIVGKEILNEKNY